MKCSCKDFQEKYPDCTDCSNGKKITVQENKRKYILNNSSGKQVCRIKIDGCVIDEQNQRKCDYLIIASKTEDLDKDNNIDYRENLFFVELKGKDLIGDVEQLTQTIEYFKPQIIGKIFARIVLSRVPNPRSIETDARVKKLKDILKKYDGNLTYSSIQYENDKI